MPPVPPLALGLDIGTTNTKAALTELAAEGPIVRAVAAAPTPEPAALGHTLTDLLHRVLAGRPAPAAVGITSMAETGVPLDPDGAPVGDWLRWDGHRAGAEADELAGRLGWSELVRATGVRPAAKVPLATWAWLRRHEPARLTARHRWCGVADLGCFLLTGRLATDHTLAGRTMAYRLPAAGGGLPAGFDPALLAEVGLRPEQLPDVVPPGIAGTVVAGPFTAAGLVAGTPVTVAGHDHAVGAYAAGVRRPGQVADSVGTAEALLTVVATPPDPVAVGRAGMSSVVTVEGRFAAVLAGSPSAGAMVEWWLAHEAAGTSAAELFDAVAALDDGPSDVLVLPYLHGRQAPAPDPRARVQVIGSRGGLGAAPLAKALLEGLCLQARWILTEQATLAGERPAAEPIALLGGPVAANPAWPRLKSIVTGRTHRLVAEPEACAAGAALLAAARTGLVDEPVPALPARTVAVPRPRPDYDRTFAAFVAAATKEIA